MTHPAGPSLLMALGASGGVPILPFSTTFLFGDYFYDTGGSSHNYGQVKIGSPKVGDIIAFCFGNGTTGGQNFTGGTIGDQPIDVLGQAAGNNTRAAILYHVVQVASPLIGQDTAELVLTFSGSTTRSNGGTYLISNAEAVPFDFDFPAGGGGASRTTIIDIPDGGAALAVANNGGPIGDWTNATEDFAGSGTSAGWSMARSFSLDEGGIFNLSLTNDSCRCLGSGSFIPRVPNRTKIEFVTAYATGSNNTVYSTSFDVGDEDPTRHFVFFVSGAESPSIAPISVVFDGNPTTFVDAVLSVAEAQGGYVYKVAYPTGTGSKTLTVTFANSQARQLIYVCKVTGGSGNCDVVSVSKSLAQPISFSGEAVPGDAFAGFAFVQTGGSTNWGTWTGARKESDNTVESTMTGSFGISHYSTNGTKIVQASSGATDTDRRAGIGLFIR